MDRKIIIRLGRIAAALAILAGIGLLSKGNLTTTALANENITVNLGSGDFIAYSIDYPGDNSQVGFTITYDPLDEFSHDPQVVTLDAYGPGALPPKSKPIGVGRVTSDGVKYYQLGGRLAGTYVILIHNWDPKGRTLAIHIATSDPATGGPVPPLHLFSQSGQPEPPKPVPGLPGVMTIQFPTPTPMPTPTIQQANTGAGSFSITIPGGGGWAAFNLAYPGSNLRVDVTFTYTPADEFNSSAKSVYMDAFAPGISPENGQPVGVASLVTFGKKNWSLSAKDAGTYTLVVHNWDRVRRPLTFNFTSVYFDSGLPGPDLVLAASGQ